MLRRSSRPQNILIALALGVAMFATPLAAVAQTPTNISLHSNKYKPADDVKVGQQAAVEAEKQFPLLRDSSTTNFVEDVGQRLVDAIPSEFQHPEFRYSFKVINARDINAFALPGGPTYVNRGMIEAAKNEGEMAGVMAHELAHVALRHGTAQATKAQKYSILAGIGAIAGSILVGPQVGQAVQSGVGLYFLKFSREYEKEADLLGARIMADAGYDPMDLANMFRTIEAQGGGSGPQFMSDHPNPGNRYNYIQQESRLLRVSRNPIKVTPEFSRTQARLREMPRARSYAEIAQANQNGQGNNNSDGGTYGGSGGGYSTRVPAPSARFRSINVGNLVTMNVPDNWRQFQEESSVTFSPEGAYGNDGITHGAILGIAQPQNRQLQGATNEYLQDLLNQQSNAYLRRQTNSQRTYIDGRAALATTLAGRSPITNRTETVTVYTTMLNNGQLIYFIAVAPQSDGYAYGRTYQSMVGSMRLND
ncbi:MAG: M48 family metallopeptidase [Pyrinomonadaceae bacterium]